MQVQQDFKVNDGASTITLQAVTYIASGKCGDNLTWTLDQNGLLTISGTGDMWDYECGHEMDEYEYKRSPWHIGYVWEDDYYGKQIREIVVKNGVTSIGAYAFEGEIATNIIIPSSVTDIREGAMDDCSKLTNIQVDVNNRAYCTVDGVLFNKDKTILLQHPGGKDGSYKIPDGVNTIGSRAFAWSYKLENVILPDSVNTIKEGAFWESGLHSITIGTGVNRIEKTAFSNLHLYDVYYRGSKEQWDNIYIEEGNTDLTSATIHYNS